MAEALVPIAEFSRTMSLVGAIPAAGDALLNGPHTTPTDPPLWDRHVATRIVNVIADWLGRPHLLRFIDSVR
jgi:hypothetical protein